MMHIVKKKKNHPNRAWLTKRANAISGWKKTGPDGHTKENTPRITSQKSYRKHFDIDGNDWVDSFWRLKKIWFIFQCFAIPRHAISFTLNSFYLSNRRRVHRSHRRNDDEIRHRSYCKILTQWGAHLEQMNDTGTDEQLFTPLYSDCPMPCPRWNTLFRNWKLAKKLPKLCLAWSSHR